MALGTALIVVLSAWGALALWYQAPGGSLSRALIIVLWASFSGSMLWVLWAHRPLPGTAGFALGFIALLWWWHSIEPSNDRLWADDVARQTSGEVNASQVILHNVRNFDWRSDSDYTQRWETRSYNLDRVTGVDLITSYWSSPAIAHVLVSFSFNDGQQVAFSVEIRREKPEAFSEIGGFFKEYELSVIAADERDVVRVRTNIRKEDDYLYRLRLPRRDIRSLFLAYVQEANHLVQTPRFYNTITVNCTTLVYHMVQRIVGHLPLDYRLLLSGYLPSYVYSVGGMDSRQSLEQLRREGRITDRARAADHSDSFSADIRAGIPELPPEPVSP
jgi:Domain of unknown function (DUF4105)